MNKKRLVTFGCSYPFGQGLPDCIGHNSIYAPGPNPSLYAFPSLIAKQIGVENINLARPGASNKEIVYKVQQFQFERDDNYPSLSLF